MTPSARLTFIIYKMDSKDNKISQVSKSSKNGSVVNPEGLLGM